MAESLGLGSKTAAAKVVIQSVEVTPLTRSLTPARLVVTMLTAISSMMMRKPLLVLVLLQFNFFRQVIKSWNEKEYSQAAK